MLQWQPVDMCQTCSHQPICSGSTCLSHRCVPHFKQKQCLGRSACKLLLSAPLILGLSFDDAFTRSDTLQVTSKVLSKEHNMVLLPRGCSRWWLTGSTYEITIHMSSLTNFTLHSSCTRHTAHRLKSHVFHTICQSTFRITNGHSTLSCLQTHILSPRTHPASTHTSCLHTSSDHSRCWHTSSDQSRCRHTSSDQSRCLHQQLASNQPDLPSVLKQTACLRKHKCCKLRLAESVLTQLHSCSTALWQLTNIQSCAR